MFNIPESPADTMTKIAETYDLWYHCWATSYVPLIMERKKWFVGDENLKVNDIVYFKLEDSPLGALWRVGKVDSVKLSRDGKVREINVTYKVITDDEPGWRHNVVMRPVTQCIKLFKMEDTPYAENMKEIKLLAEQIRKRKGEFTDGIGDQAPDDAPEIITVQNDKETD